MAFLVLWSVGVLSLAMGAFRAWRRKLRWPRGALLLAVSSAGFVWWLGAVRATPERMILAAAAGDASTVERCLRRGIEPDATYVQLAGFGGRSQSSTALHAAATRGHLEVVEILVQAGADLEWKDGVERTPLDHAIAYGHLDVVRRLLDHGATWGTSEANSGEGRSAPLVLAVQACEHSRGYPLREMLVLLARRGADGTDPACVRRALWMTEHEHVHDFLEAIGPGLELARAIVSGSAERAIELHRLDARRGRLGVFEDDELLHLAAKFGNTPLVDELLKAGVPVDATARGTSGLRPLHQAVLQGQADTVQRLLEAGADPRHVDRGWGTSLHRASLAGHADIVRLLLDRGVPVDEPASEDDPRTALHFAAQGGSFPVVELLLERGADAARRDGQDRTPAERARQFHHASIVERLTLDGGD